jgi:hypothetical protein
MTTSTPHWFAQVETSLVLLEYVGVMIGGCDSVVLIVTHVKKALAAAFSGSLAVLDATAWAALNQQILFVHSSRAAINPQ